MMKKPLINSYTIFLLVDFRRSELFQLQLKEQKISRKKEKETNKKRKAENCVCRFFLYIHQF